MDRRVVSVRVTHFLAFSDKAISGALECIDMDKYDYICMAEREKWNVPLYPNDPLASQNSSTTDTLSGLPLILPR